MLKIASLLFQLTHANCGTHNLYEIMNSSVLPIQTLGGPFPNFRTEFILFGGLLHLKNSDSLFFSSWLYAFLPLR